MWERVGYSLVITAVRAHVALVGTLQLVVPDAEGPLELALRLDHPEATSDNAYQAVISR